MSRFATGVAIATCSHAGQPHGLTINSLVSVSLEPALLSFCIDRAAQALTPFLESEGFAIHVLGTGQQELSNRFARRAGDRFQDMPWQPGSLGSPLLDGVLARFECAKWKTIEAGDHFILLGEVRSIDVQEGQPLLYFGSRYRRLGE
jgi:flavin reductase (DIM6/NTAB) family NADH-FMN oxidoreductase RutF